MLRRSLLVAAPLAAALTAVAMADAGPPSGGGARLDPATTALSGRWQVDGVDARGQAFAGVLDLAGRGGALRYVRRVPGRDGRPADERGEARLVGGRLYLLERTAGPGLTASFGDLDLGAPPRRAIYQATTVGAHVLDGRFSGSSRGGGRETLRRADADNALTLLVDGPEAFPSIYAAIRAARRSICLQTFSWFDDRAGQEMVDLLARKRAEGVAVRCLVEAFPQKGGVGWKTGKALRARGIDLIIHHTLTEGLKNDLRRLGRKLASAVGRLFGRPAAVEPAERRGFFNHDHRKLIVVDGQVAFTGGMNIGDKYLEGTTWHDLHCRVEGSAVRPMEAMFFDRWRAAGGQGAPDAGRAPSAGPGDYPVEVLENLPGVRLDVTRRYLEAIDRAERSIQIENAYLLYDPVVAGLKRRATEGVRVRVVIPSNDLNDEALARDAFLWIQNDVVRSGVELYKYRDRMSHGKVAVFDHRTATIGTTNLDMIAMERNAELNLWVPDARFARTLTTRVFEADIPRSDRVVVAPLPWWKRVVGGTMHAMRSFL